MNINKYLLSVVTLLTLFLPFSSFGATSTFILKLQPYVGIDVQWRHMGYKKGEGDNLFRKNVLQGNGFVGIETNSFLGFEGGYESTLKSTKAVSLGAGDAGLGYIVQNNPLTVPEGRHYKTLLRGWHLNILGFSPWILKDNSLRFFGGMGFSHKRIVLVDTPLSVGGFALPQAYVDSYRRTFTKRKTLLRLSAGMQKMISDRCGIRLTAVWENTHKFSKLKPKEKPTGNPNASVKNSITVGLGAFVNF